tara:strand:+ start:596 stop:832 length:237 start_codon:yes stop_codon:yes gene_type:complete
MQEVLPADGSARDRARGAAARKLEAASCTTVPVKTNKKRRHRLFMADGGDKQNNARVCNFFLYTRQIENVYKSLATSP